MKKKSLLKALLLSTAVGLNLWVSAQPNLFKAPLYWSPYEANIENDKPITQGVWLENTNWIAENYLPYGYDMICTDGWIEYSTQTNENGYILKYNDEWDMTWHDMGIYLAEKGLRHGVYYNPFWVTPAAVNDPEKTVVGTNIKVGDIVDRDYQFPGGCGSFLPGDRFGYMFCRSNDVTLYWVDITKPGAEEYVKGYVDYFASAGMEYLRVDFLSWYEDGIDKGSPAGKPDRPIEHYQTMLRWIRDACAEHNIFFSMVMPHLKNEGANEIQYGGHMIRVNEDAGQTGGWARWSELDRGRRFPYWSQYRNAVDGATYWSKISDQLILDCDFISLNKFANDEERKSVISLCLVSGGPVTIADRVGTIGNNGWLYQNQEMLELNRQGFVGKPLTNDPTDVQSQIWTGQLNENQWIVALFNREGEAQVRSIDLNATLGITPSYMRDLWLHEEVTPVSNISVTIPAHGCKVFLIEDNPNQLSPPVLTPESGSYGVPQFVEMISPQNANIFYTLDGSDPTPSSTLYTEPVLISEPTTIKAYCASQGMHDSKVVTFDYLIFENKCANAIGFFTFEQWNNIPGMTIADIPVTEEPDVVSTSLSSMEIPVNAGDNYGVRLSGLLCAPVDGDYTFYVAGDDYVELYLSTDNDRANKERIAYHEGWTSSRQWDKYATQQSSAITLTGGNQYYVEALMKEGDGGDNLAVRWVSPLADEIIPAQYLSPYQDEDCTPREIIIDPVPDKDVSDDPFPINVSAIASTGEDFSYEISGPATLNGNIVTLTGSNGPVTICVSLPAEDPYCSAESCISFEVTGGIDHQPAMFIGATFNNWNPAVNPMTLVGEIWVAEDIQLEAGSYELKFANTSDWTGDDWGVASGLTGIAELATGGLPNIDFSIGNPGVYTITFDDNSLAYSISSDNDCVPQNLTFSFIPDQTVDAPSVILDATSSSGLPVAFTDLSGPAVLEGNVLTLNGETGLVRVTAIQKGDLIYCAANPVTRSFYVRNDVNDIISGATYSIIAKHSNKAFDVSDVSLDNGANIHQWEYLGNNNQLWVITEENAGEYSIVSVNSNKAVDVEGATSEDGANIHQWAYLGNDNQKWILNQEEPGYYSIVSVNSGKAIEVENGSNNNGSNIRQNSFNGADNQLWAIDLVSNAISVAANIDSVVNTAGDVIIYPNPVTDILNIDLRNFGPAQIEIFSITGEVLLQEKSDKDIFRINVNKLNTQGAILIKVTNQSKSVSLKSIIY